MLSGITLEKSDHIAGWVVLLAVVIGGVFLGIKILALKRPKREVTVTSSQPMTTDLPGSQAVNDQPLKSSVATKKSTPAKKSVKPTQGSSLPFAGSKTGNVYYPKTCAGFSRIKPENRVYFTTSAQAEASGRTLSKKCSQP